MVAIEDVSLENLKKISDKVIEERQIAQDKKDIEKIKEKKKIGTAAATGQKYVVVDDMSKGVERYFTQLGMKVKEEWDPGDGPNNPCSNTYTISGW